MFFPTGAPRPADSADNFSQRDACPRSITPGTSFWGILRRLTAKLIPEEPLMPGSSLPYQPIPQTLYTSAGLFRGYDLDDPASWSRTVDFEIYRHFVTEGRGAPRNPYIRMMQALHD